MPLEDDLDALYACPLGEFIERRKTLAQALRKAGKKDDAARIAAASKPTPAAWAVNQLARQHPEEIAALMAVGERLRALVRAAFTGSGDASAMSEVQSAQRAVVTRLKHLAARTLEAAGGSTSDATLERVAATLTTISTTGAWGDGPAAQLARDLDPPSLDVLATLVEGVAVRATATTGREEGAAPHAGHAEARASQDDHVRQETDRGAQRSAQADEDARRAAAEARARIERAEATFRAAAAIEEQRRTEVERVRVAVAAAMVQREQRESSAREARRVATALEQAAEEARRKAEEAVLAARNAEVEAVKGGKEEQTARADLAAAEKALARAAAELIAAEEALVHERREQTRNLRVT